MISVKVTTGVGVGAAGPAEAGWANDEVIIATISAGNIFRVELDIIFFLSGMMLEKQAGS